MKGAQDVVMDWAYGIEDPRLHKPRQEGGCIKRAGSRMHLPVVVSIDYAGNTMAFTASTKCPSDKYVPGYGSGFTERLPLLKALTPPLDGPQQQRMAERMAQLIEARCGLPVGLQKVSLRRVLAGKVVKGVV